MNKRKKLTEIQAAFERDSGAIEAAESTKVEEEVKADVAQEGVTFRANKSDGSLSAALKVPKKSAKKIRFTLDLEKPLDDRLNRASSKLNRSKAELVRFAVKRLLEELESEWKS